MQKKFCYNEAGQRNQQQKANNKLDKPVTQRDREVKHGCKSSTNSETGRSKKMQKKGFQLKLADFLV